MTAYLDSSSLVKLYVDEAGSDDVRQLVGTAGAVATSIVAYAEVCASLARQRRERALTPRAFAQAKRMFEEDWSRIVVLNVTPAISRRAGQLAERHKLRGFDSIHLASFATLLERSPDDALHFSSADARLSRAAGSLR